MIVKILTSSSSFEGVDYNERKVNKGTAELLEIKNFGYLQELGTVNNTSLRRYLTEYSEKNDRIQNTQLHVAFSCKGEEMPHEQLVEFAHRWLDKMGYGQDGQPLLIYGHHDTDNNHIHVLTSRVDPQGRKIDHNFERERSQKVIEELLGENRQERLDKNIINALSYRYSNISQFKAILEASGYEVYDKDDEVFIKRSGVVQGHIKMAMIEDKKQKLDYLTSSRKKQLKAFLIKYRDIASNKSELQSLMKQNFGIDVIFVGSKDNPYGYMLVDHKDKAVYKGSSVMPLKQLLMFQDKKELLEKLDISINAMLEDNPLLTTKQLNTMLRRQFGVQVVNGAIKIGREKEYLPDYIRKTLYRNDRCSWLQSFHPTTKEEREVLCFVGKVNNVEYVKVEPDAQKNVTESLSAINDILDSSRGLKAYSGLREASISVIKRGEDYFFIDFAHNNILKASDYDINVNALSLPHGQERNQSQGESPQTKGQSAVLPSAKGGRGIMRGGGGGRASDTNREWEVGGHGNYDDIDDERTLRR